MRQQKIIWGALVFSTFIYVGVAYALAPDPALPFSESVMKLEALMFYGVALVTFIAALAVPGMMLNLPPQKRLVMTMATFEACTIMGLVVAILLKDWRLIVPTWIASLIGFMREYPSSEASAPA